MTSRATTTIRMRRARRPGALTIASMAGGPHGELLASVRVVTDVAIAAPNEAAADAGEQVARAGGNAVDAALPPRS